jgi:hypothetical protein
MRKLILGAAVAALASPALALEPEGPAEAYARGRLEQAMADAAKFPQTGTWDGAWRILHPTGDVAGEHSYAATVLQDTFKEYGQCVDAITSMHRIAESFKKPLTGEWWCIYTTGNEVPSGR